MIKNEWLRLKGFWIAKRNAPWTTNVGKKIAKGRAAGVGQITLLKARVIPGVNLERVFVNHK